MNDQYITISDLNNYVKGLIDNEPFLHKVYLKGEISNFKNHSRGHLYFTLKDEESRLAAVMFASNTYSLDFTPEDGMNVLVEGRISCYPAAGTYQIYVEKMQQDGIGNLFIEFEKLKAKLQKEGLFDDSHKKKIPRFPKRIGVITAPTGAAIKDILSTIKRRWPLSETILFPALVQGKDAAPDIVRQIKRTDDYDLDVLIVGRGGGSIEDLWAFNEEIVARAIYDCETPIISAVGHEIDFTIADFVSDLRAPTPTGAAEMAVPTVMEVDNLINQYRIRLNKNIKNTVNNNFIRLRNLKNSFVLKNPLSLYEIKEQRLDNAIDKINIYINNIINNNSFRLKNVLSTLETLNPVSTLNRGYAMVIKDNKVVTSGNDLSINDEIVVELNKENINAKVVSITKKGS